MKMTFKMTKNDIRTGECGNAEKCAFANTVRRVTGAPKVAVGFQTSIVSEDGRTIMVAANPKKLLKFIDRFDFEPDGKWVNDQWVPGTCPAGKGKKVKPITVTLDFKIV